MVARMMRWPRPPAARKFRVRLVVRRTEGLRPLAEPASLETEASAKPRVAVEVRWKGPKASALSSLRRAVRRNRTREEASAAAGEGGGALASVAWEEEFESVVTLAAASHREAAAFQPWELAFTVFTDVNKGPKIKPSILGTASLNLADYASAPEHVIEIILPLSVPDGAPESAPSLHLTLSMVELRVLLETSDASQPSAVATPLSPLSGYSLPGGKGEVSVIKAGLRGKILTDLVSTRKSRTTKAVEIGAVFTVMLLNILVIPSLLMMIWMREHRKMRSRIQLSGRPSVLRSVNYVGGLLFSHVLISTRFLRSFLSCRVYRWCSGFYLSTRCFVRFILRTTSGFMSRINVRFDDCLLNVPCCYFTPFLIISFVYAHMFVNASHIAMTSFDDVFS